jgi:putative membrane protein
MSIQKRFSIAELERIKVAVKDAESKISGEIVPVFVERSGFYTTANYRAGIIGASLVFFAVILLDRYVTSLSLYNLYDPLFIFLAVLVGGVAGAAVPHFIHSARRWFVSQKHMDEATRKKAENAFLQEEVFNTRHRTGIMIFVSFFEREIIVMADRGISKVVEQKEWDKMVRMIVENVRKGKIIEGMETAIKRCGEILLEKGFIQTPDDINELRDDLRVE